MTLNFSLKQASIFVLIGLTLTLQACSPSLKSYDVRKRGAPTSQDDLGIVVTGAEESEIAELLKEKPLAQFRLINKTAKQYEIFNVEMELIKKSVTGQIEPNTWISLDLAPPRSLFSLIHDPTSRIKQNEDPQPVFEPCVKSSQMPLASFEILFPEEGLAKPILVGSEINVTGTAEAHPDHPGELKIAFLGFGPKGSLQDRILVPGTELKLKVDTVGIYQLGFLVQDSRNVCNLQTFIAFVTDNPKYVGSSVDVSQDQQAIELSTFSHLNEIEVPAAWTLADREGEDVVIAVIDSGVNYNHSALLQNIELNTLEIPDNGLDDDGNGLVDDYIGYDFINSDEFPFDDVGHGSHVAGLAASSFFGVAKKAKILPIKALGHRGGDSASMVGGIRYAVERKAKIINMSFGDYAKVNALIVQAMNYADQQGTLVIAASGNGDSFFGLGVNTDKNPMFPASFPNSNIISVAAKSKGRVLATYSNFGPMTVDIAAPGGADPDDLLLSTAHANPKNIQYIGMSGTSMATPLVSGVAALVWSLKPNLSALEVKDILLQSGDQKTELQDLVSSSSYLNARKAAELTKSRSPLILR